ncbi:hypothetical protein HAX54_006183 [Datura stramonium]|uniref:Gag-pol polyprotein n=1 Tax=Datura stramonium TaxID=4076 RepID=A0ABS8WTV5_DATST|nr:hypothetical protein [Datura stramonium]
MNPLEFLGSKVGEDPHDFIDEIVKITQVMGVSSSTCVELVREPNVSLGDSRLESRNHSHSTGFEMPRLEDLWDMEQYFKAVCAPFDDQGTMATIYLSGDATFFKQELLIVRIPYP